MPKLVIDDLRVLNVPGEVIYARTVSEALELLQTNKRWEEIYMDHDLGSRNDHYEDIWPIIAYFEERNEWSPIQTGEIYIISSNPVGSQRMKIALNRLGYSVTVLDPRPILASVLPW